MQQLTKKAKLNEFRFFYFYEIIGFIKSLILPIPLLPKLFIKAEPIIVPFAYSQAVLKVCLSEIPKPIINLLLSSLLLSSQNKELDY